MADQVTSQDTQNGQSGPPQPYTGVESTKDLNDETVAALQAAGEKLRADEEAYQAKQKEYLDGVQQAKEGEGKSAEASSQTVGDMSTETPAAPQPTEESIVDDVQQQAAPDQFSPTTLDAMQRFIEEQQKFENEKREFKPEREQLQKIKELHQNYGVNRLDTIKELISLVSTRSPDSELRDLLDEYALQVMGVEPTTEQKALSDTRRLSHEVEKLKQQQAEADKKREEERQAREQQAHEREAMKVIAQEIPKDAEKFPFLARLMQSPIKGEQPGEAMVWGRIKDHYQRTGQELSLHQAATLEEERLRGIFEPFKDILSSQAPKPVEKTEQQQAPNGSGPRTISTSMTSASSAPPQLSSTGYIEDDYESQQRSVALLKLINQQRGQQQQS